MPYGLNNVPGVFWAHDHWAQPDLAIWQTYFVAIPEQNKKKIKENKWNFVLIAMVHPIFYQNWYNFTTAGCMQPFAIWQTYFIAILEQNWKDIKENRWKPVPVGCSYSLWFTPFPTKIDVTLQPVGTALPTYSVAILEQK